MYNSIYLYNMTRTLDRVLVFKHVFGEYVETCKNIVSGKCLASENLATLRQYFLRNLVRFKPFMNDVRTMRAPEKYAELHATLIEGLTQYEDAIISIMLSIKDDGLDQREFLTAASKQERAVEAIDSIFIDRLRMENGELTA